jgi:hypothetical protein
MAKSLDEVVVVAYGKQTAKSIVGSVATIDSEVLLTTSYKRNDRFTRKCSRLILLLLEECQVKTLQLYSWNRFYQCFFRSFNYFRWCAF